MVLNRPLKPRLVSCWGIAEASASGHSDPVYSGGPVEGSVMLLQACVGLAEEEHMVYVACEQERIADIASQPDGNQTAFRLFDGYSGWGPGQLESEVREGSWLIWDIPAEQLFADPDHLWQFAIRQIGRQVISAGIARATPPVDPLQN